MSVSGAQVSMTLARPPDYTDHLKQNLEAIFSSSDALVCWDRWQTVNLVSTGGLVEQSNAAKNKPC